jgi:glycolate oxidase FAD binding subunit
MHAILESFGETLRAAGARGAALCIRAGGTKDFYGNLPQGECFDPRAFTGIVDYDPSELVITARCGTPLEQLEAMLASQGQMLSFEPPHFGPGATLGGCIAAGLAGPRRASAGTSHGAVRDVVLGATLLDGRARLLRFGGTVMKNVAGYDVARALAGSLGMLGLITQVSLKVLPRPRAERTLAFELEEPAALEALNRWAGRPLPVSASSWCEGRLMLRLSGAEPAVAAACRALGGEGVGEAAAEAHWRALREQELAWFAGAVPLWRVALPPTAPPLDLGVPQLIEWGGALRWLRAEAPPAQMRARAVTLGGHATLFRGGDRAGGVFTPLSPALLAIHRRLKQEFDPAGLFNRGRLVAGL